MYRLPRTDPLRKIARELATAPGDLGVWCLGAIDELLVAHATRTARWLHNLAGDTGPDSGDVEAAGALACEELGAHFRRE